jgi:TonB family protein
MGRAELQDFLLQWDPDADNNEVRRVFALNHISEIARQASQLPAAGGLATGRFTYGDSRFDIELKIVPGTAGATVEAVIRHDGEPVSAPRVVTPFGERAIVSSEDGPDAPLLFLVLDIRRVSAEELRRKGMRYAWKSDVALVDGERILAPKALNRVNPAYPEAAKQARAEGIVVLRAVIGAEGSVEAVEIVQGQPNGLSEAAVEAVRQWRFAPATLEGKPVRVVMTLTINFVLPAEDKKS